MSNQNEDQEWIKSSTERRARLEMILRNWLNKIEERKTEFQNEREYYNTTIRQIDEQYNRNYKIMQQLLQEEQRFTKKNKNKKRIEKFNILPLQQLFTPWMNDIAQFDEARLLTLEDVRRISSEFRSDYEAILKRSLEEYRNRIRTVRQEQKRQEETKREEERKQQTWLGSIANWIANAAIGTSPEQEEEEELEDINVGQLPSDLRFPIPEEIIATMVGRNRETLRRWQEKDTQVQQLMNQREELTHQISDLQLQMKTDKKNRNSTRLQLLQVRKQLNDLFFPLRDSQIQIVHAQEEIFIAFQEMRSRWVHVILDLRHSQLDEFQELIDTGVGIAAAEKQMEQIQNLNQLKNELDEIEQQRLDSQQQEGEIEYEAYVFLEDLLQKDRAIFEQAWQEFEVELEQERVYSYDINPEDWPEPTAVNFASLLLRVLPPAEYEMPVPDVSQGSRCSVPDTNTNSNTTSPNLTDEEAEELKSRETIRDSISRLNSSRDSLREEEQEQEKPTKRNKKRKAVQMIEPTSYQRIIGQLFHPLLSGKYSGTLADHSVGSGKTLSAYQAIYKWFRNAGPKTLPPTTREVLVLLPNTRLLGTWSDELAKSPLFPYFIEARTFRDNPNCVEYYFENNFIMVLQNMTAALPERIYQRWIKTYPENNVSAIASRMLREQNYSSNPIYSSLSSKQIEGLNKNLKSTVSKMLRTRSNYRNDRRVAMPDFVITDEAHALVNSSSIIQRADQSNCVLAWAMTLRYSETVRKLFMTGTPLYDDNRTMDYFRLLNLNKRPDDPTRLPEGSWRRVLSLSAQREENKTGGSGREKGKGRSLTEIAEEAEEKYIRSTYFNENEQWKSRTIKEQFQRAVASFYSYVDVSADYTVYPQLDVSCAEKGNCIQVYVPDEDNDSEEYVLRPLKEVEDSLPLSIRNTLNLSSDTEARSIKSTILLVPLEEQVYENYKKKIPEDLKDYSTFQLRTEDCENQTEPNLACLRYSDARLKLAISQGWGFKPASKNGKITYAAKFKLLQRYLEASDRGKHWIFSSTRLYANFGKFFIDYFKKQKYEIIGMGEVFNFIMSNLPNPARLTEEEMKEEIKRTNFADFWYEQRQEKPRLLFFGASMSVADLDKIRRRAQRDYYIDDSLVLSVMSGIYNHALNYEGRYIRGFVGDVTSRVGLTLLDTTNVYLMEPSETESAERQAVARILRYCSLARNPNIREWLVKLYTFVSTVPLKKKEKEKPKKKTSTSSKKRKPIEEKEEKKVSSKKRGRKPKVQEEEEEKEEKKRTSSRKKRNVRGGAEEEEKEVVALLNEQYQIRHLQQVSNIGAELLKAAREAAFDCRLLQKYNSRPGYPIQCFRAGEGKEQQEEEEIYLPPRYFQFAYDADFTRLLIELPNVKERFLVSEDKIYSYSRIEEQQMTFRELAKSIFLYEAGFQITPMSSYSWTDEVITILIEEFKNLEEELGENLQEDQEEELKYEEQKEKEEEQSNQIETLKELLTFVPPLVSKDRNNPSLTQLTIIDDLAGLLQNLSRKVGNLLKQIIITKREEVVKIDPKSVKRNQAISEQLWDLRVQEDFVQGEAVRVSDLLRGFRPEEINFPERSLKKGMGTNIKVK